MTDGIVKAPHTALCETDVGRSVSEVTQTHIHIHTHTFTPGACALQVKSSLYINNRQPYGSLSNVLRKQQQRERVSVGRAMRDGVGTGGSGSEAARALEGDGDGAMGREGVDGVEQGASLAAREAEGDDEDEAMVGDENVSMQEAEGGGGATGGIKKGKRRRGKRKCQGNRQWLAARGADRPLAVGEASGS